MDNPPKVLVIDDDPDVVATLTEILTSGGYEAQGVANWRELLKSLKAEPYPDAIFLDVMLPEFNGFELLAMLKSNPNRQHIPVVVITALGPEGVGRALEWGAADYLTKPLHAEDLLASLRRVLKAPSMRTPLRKGPPNP